MSLGALLQPAIDAALVAVRSVPWDGVAVGVEAAMLQPGAGVVEGDYTPVGGTVRPATHAAVRHREEPHGNVQRRGATIRLFQLEVDAEPTDGATYLADDVLWTIRTARREAATFVCEAWA